MHETRKWGPNAIKEHSYLLPHGGQFNATYVNKISTFPLAAHIYFICVKETLIKNCKLILAAREDILTRS